MTTTYLNVSSASQLSSDIAAIDGASASVTNTNYLITLQAGATLTESADIAAINLAGTNNTLTINGQGAFPRRRERLPRPVRLFGQHDDREPNDR
jgi:hypothetical protein